MCKVLVLTTEVKVLIPTHKLTLFKVKVMKLLPYLSKSKSVATNKCTQVKKVESKFGFQVK